MSFKLTIDKKGLAILTFDLKNEKVNILRSDVLIALDQKLTEIKNNKKIKILLFKSNKQNNFIAGADINEIKDITTEAEVFDKVKKGQDILRKIALLKPITIAYINGSCLGGGTELALSCDYRIASDNPKTMIGLPEVNLGILPGFGGTQNLPRLIGLVKSLPLILTGKAVDYKKAFRIGLIDGYFPLGYEKTHLAKFLANIEDAKFSKKLRNRRAKRPFIEKYRFLQFLIFKQAKKTILAKTKGHYPAPLAALRVVQNSYNTNINKGLKIELAEFAKLVTGDICKNLISLYFTSEKIRKDKGVSTKVENKEIKNSLVLGAGIMGGGIAWLYSKADIAVRMKDINLTGLSLGFKQINKIYQTLLKIRKYNKAEVTNKLALISATTSYQGCKSADIVAEAVIEDMKIKKSVLKEAEKHISEQAIIASNTSSLSITEMAKSLKKPERFVGMHFFNPVNKMPLVEIIPGKKTSDQTIATIVSLTKKLGKTPIIVGNCSGFLVNRILLTYVNEAFKILAETGKIEHIDRLIEDFGMPMGPFTLADTVGLDVGYKVAKILEDNYGQRMELATLIDQIYNDKKLLGKKSGAGVYLYNKKEKTVNNEVLKLCKNEHISDDDIRDRLILIMVNEAYRCLAEDVVASPEYLDMAMIMGTGFPAFRGGLIRYSQSLGIENIVTRLEQLAAKYGERFTPASAISR